METRKKTTAGVLFWTPAPARTSPTSSVISEDEWEDEDGEEAGKEDDFVSQMDDNGIIGLSEALDNVELGQTYGDAGAEYNRACFSTPLTPEEGDHSGCERDTPPEEWNYSPSEHLSFTEAAGEDVQTPSPCNGAMSRLKAQTEGEEVRQRKEELKIEQLSERDTYLDMTEEEKDGEKEEKRSDRKREKHERELGAAKGLAGGSLNNNEIERIRARSCVAQLSVVEPAEVSNYHCPVSQSASAVTAPTYPHLLHFTAEEIAAAPGIEAETFPEMGFIESLPESHSSRISPVSSPRPQKSEKQELKGLQAAAVFPEQVMANCYSGVCNGPLKGSVESDKQPHHSQRKMSQPSPEATQSWTRSLSTVRADSLRQSPDGELRTPRARTKAAEVTESRNGPLSYRTPDFSQVEPRVRFPKGGYKPPKSRRSSKRESLSPEPPIVFKSPADIVKEVLLNTADGSPAPSNSNRPPISAPNSTVPQEFRCRQQATALLEQLQEDYNRLLTKYAEAENTIDRLRLEAKDRCVEKQQPRPSQHQHTTDTAVNLYSEPPKPGHLVHSGLSHDSSKIMTLDFPQAQRAEINSASLHNGHSTHQSLQVGQQLAKILYSQADKFFQQLQTFEDLLKRGKLKPFEQMKGLSQLTEGLNSLERGYLLARDEHKLLQQRGAEISHFDPERELEGLIYQCGLHMDELKEQVEQMQQEQPTCEAPPSPPPQPTPSSVPSEGGETLTHPQRPHAPLLVDPGRVEEVEVRSARGESDEEEAEMDNEDTLSSLYLKPLNDKHRCAEKDFAALMDHYQSFKELPKMFAHGHREEDFLSAALGSGMQPGDEEAERRGRGTGLMEVQKSLPERVKAKSDHQESPVGISKQRTSRSSPPSRRASSQSTLLAVHPPSSHKRVEMRKSHSSSLSSLGEITASERSNPKLQPGSRRVLSQDGIISPETDSGFVGSESSHLTPAAAPSPLHQRALQSVSVHQEGNTGKHQTGPVSAPSPASSQSHSRTATKSRGASQLGPNQPISSRQRRHTFSCSPQRRVSQTELTRTDSGTSESGLESDSTHTVSEDGQSDQYTSINSLHSSHPSSSPTAWYHHGDSLRALGARQVANRNDTIQTLQAEVTALTETLESCLSNKPLSSTRAAPSAQVNNAHHYTSTPHIRSGERCQSDVRRGRRERRMADEVEEESAMRRIPRERSPCVDRQKTRDILTVSELEPPTSQSQPRVSRCTQTSTAAPDSCCSHTNTVHSRRTQPRQNPSVSIKVPNRADEPDSRSRQAPVCLECSSCHRGRSERPGGGNREPTHSSSHCRHCPLCGHPELYRGTKPDCRRDSDAPTHTSCQQAESPDRAARSRYNGAPPALLQCMPVCPPPLLMYSLPLHVSPSSCTGTSSGVRGHVEVRGRLRRSLSTDKQGSLDSSLNRAIRAARNMKHTSGHMARSLATGLQYQELLTQSFSC